MNEKSSRDWASLVSTEGFAVTFLATVFLVGVFAILLVGALTSPPHTSRPIKVISFQERSHTFQNASSLVVPLNSGREVYIPFR